MGRSDPHVFNSYLSILPYKEYRRVAFLGFPGENVFTKSIPGDDRDFYDLQLGNWDINDDVWDVKDDYDLVICTRCAYFAKDPGGFLKKCLGMISPGGFVLVDWGVGDHWRFEKYKIGWVKDNEHEFAYEDENYLWSAIWHDEFMSRPAFINFQEWVKKFGYSDVKKAIFEEVPSVLDLGTQNDILTDIAISCQLLSLWEESPQLYMMLLMGKPKEPVPG
tara:strand:- start:455 stop:1114 length:660 start_codon:yes stop_codon:yes gene_type:complete